MKEFIVLYHAPVDAVKQTASATAEQQAKGMAMWMQWAKECGDKLVDLGSPLTNSQELIPGGKSKNSGSDVVGYSILQAENMDEAKSLLQKHPHLGWNPDCSIEVHETMSLPGM
ncbi:MAG: hypothetical protein E6H10_13540 [Bacteroidetes bacterium]|nr:MAG: hypothetical protein E6H10_13540 [Bacteroidota bacterium]